MNREIETTIECVCHVDVNLGFGTIKKFRPCQWEFSGSKCPHVPAKFEFDWECDPRKNKCAPLQYNPQTLEKMNSNDLDDADLTEFYNEENFLINLSLDQKMVPKPVAREQSDQIMSIGRKSTNLNFETPNSFPVEENLSELESNIPKKDSHKESSKSSQEKHPRKSRKNLRNSESIPYVSKFSQSLQKDFSFIKKSLRLNDGDLKALKKRIEKLEKFRRKMR